MKKNASNTSEYILAVEPLKEKSFKEVLMLIQQNFPEATLSYQYNMLHFALGEKWIALADQKHHVGLYMSKTVITKYASELTNFNCGKSCIRLNPKKIVPTKLLLLLISESLN